MQIPENEEYARSINLIEAFFITNKATKEYYNSNIKEYFEDFRLKCRKGYFQELTNILIFKWNG